MYLLVMIVGVGLLSPALSLTCYSCSLGSSPTCTSQSGLCPSRAECAAGIMVSDGTESHQKGCSYPESCTEASINFGVSRAASNIQCCTTDLCNREPAPRPSKNSPNGKKCYTCVGTNCKATLSCLGTEDRCITATASSGGATQTLKGCASKSECDALGPSRLLQNLTRNAVYKCCAGDMCNGAAGTSAGLLLLVAPLLTQLFL